MRSSVLRIGCAALSLSVAAAALTSCSLMPPASPLPDSKPAQAEEAPGSAAASLDDGKLRILYSNGSNGGNTILCGSEVLYQASSSETVTLVPDTLTDAARYYLRQWSDPSAPTGRVSALYDRSGKEVLAFDQAYDAALTGSLLVLTVPESMAYDPAHNHAPGDCRVIDLSTGEELSVPENTYGCRIVGDDLAFNICALPADYVATENSWDEDLTPYYAVQVKDRDGNVIYQASSCSANTISAFAGDSSAPTDWLVVSHYNEDGTMGADSLYNPTTGEELTGYQQYTGAGTVSLYNNGRYQLVDLVSTEQSAVLCEYDQPIRYYAPGMAITEPDAFTPGMAGRYTFHDLLTGDVKDLYDANTDDATLAIYTTDGIVQVFDLQSGALLTDATLDPVEGQTQARAYPQSSGWVWVEQFDNDNYEVTGIQICGPEGAQKTLDPAVLNETYNYYSPLLSTEDGIYFYGCYNGPGSSWLYDVLNSDGDVVVSGLRSCAGYYANSINSLPEGVFAAVKGFRTGWMDLSGQWIYCESIFASASDESTDNYF